MPKQPKRSYHLTLRSHFESNLRFGPIESYKNSQKTVTGNELSFSANQIQVSQLTYDNSTQTTTILEYDKSIVRYYWQTIITF